MACSGCARRREAIRKAYLAAKHGFTAQAEKLGLVVPQGVDTRQAESNKRKGTSQ